MEPSQKIISAPCPDCEHTLYLGPSPKKGQKVTCPNCWAYLEILSLEPLKLDWEYFESDEAVLTDQED